MAQPVALICAAILCAFVCLSLGNVEKPYPAPLFAWSPSTSVLSSGRKWVPRSVSSVEVQKAIISLSKDGAPSTLFQELAAVPELVVLFLEPNMIFGQTTSYGGSRTVRASDSRAIKNVIEGAKASVVAPYTYDLSLTTLDEVEHSEELEETMVEFLLDFLSTSPSSSVLVDLRDTEAEPWSYIMNAISSDRFTEISREKEILRPRADIVSNGVADLLIVVLPKDSGAAASRLLSVVEEVGAFTENYVAVLTSDDFYVPSKSSESLRESNTKLDWVLRELEMEDGNKTDDVPPCRVYTTRWPEYVWEIILVSFLLVTVAMFGLCCLLGLENPSHFDNPKEKNL